MNQFADQLIILVKNPELGKVKTRLAASVGDKEALRIYKQLLVYTKSVANGTDANKFIYYSSFVEKEDIWEEEDYTKRLQQGETLGERMYNAAHEISSNHTSTVIIGSDCAELTSDILSSAYEALINYDLVIGPAQDGGYYLIGFKSPIKALFEHIDWSTEKVLQQTLAKSEENNLSYYLLETLSDVDDIEDWNRIKDRLV